MNTIKNSTNNLNNSSKELNQFTDNLKRFSVVSSAIKVGVVYAIFKRIGDFLGSFISESNAYVENLNLFTVAMREHTGVGLEYIDKLNKTLGIDPSEAMRYLGFFQQLSTAMGVAGDKAYVISKNLTSFAYDLSSLMNINIETAFTKVQSGISGELEPLRRVGFALSETTQQQVLNAEGINKRVRELTDAEKVELRYVTLLKQSANVQNDLARTLIAPANQLRILRQNIIQAARAIGNIFIPILQIVIPFVTAFMQAVRELANSLAGFFGFELPEIDYSGLAEDASDLGTSVEDIGTAADKTANKLKKITAPFDELNIIADNVESATGGVGGAGGSAGTGLFTKEQLEGFGYDVFKDAVDTNIDTIKNKLKPLLDNVLKVALAIGITLLGWKIASSLMSDLSLMRETMRQINDIKKGLVKLDQPLSDDASDLDKKANKLAKSWLLVGRNIVPIAATLYTMISHTDNLLKNSEYFNKGLEVIKDYLDGYYSMLSGFIRTALSGINLDVSGIKGLFKALDLQIGDVGVTLLGLGAIIVASPLGMPLIGTLGAVTLAYEALTLAIRGIGWAFSDSVEKADLFGDKISEATKTILQPYLDKLNEIDNKLKSIDWAKLALTGEDIATIQGQYTETFTQIEETLANKITEITDNLEPLKKEMTDVEWSALVTDSTSVYVEALGELQKYKDEVARIMAEGAKNEGIITEEGWQKLYEINAKMEDLGIDHLTKTNEERATIYKNRSEQEIEIATQNASEILTTAANTRDNIIADAEAQYDGLLEQAQKSYEAGDISREVYDGMITKATEAKEETIANANAQFEGVVDEAKKMFGDDILVNIDTWSGKVRTHLATGLIDPLKKMFTEIGERNFYQYATAFEKAAQIKSPSRYMKRIGIYLAEGLGLAGDKFSGIGKQLANSFGKSFKTESNKYFAGIEYNPEIDYQALINEAKKLGDISSAAKYEQQRNAKIQGEKLFDKWELSFDFKDMYEPITNTLEPISDDISSLNTSFEDFSTNSLNIDKENFIKFVEFLRNAFDILVNQLNVGFSSVVEAVGKIKINVTSALGNTTGSTNKKTSSSVSSLFSGIVSKLFGIRKFASGGFPTAGEMFVANEAGAELVGRIGNRTAVVNNSQIVAAVSAGVASAVSAVVSPQNNNIPMDNRIYIDGDLLIKAQTKAQRNRGVNLGLGAFAR